jgi:anti-anti-sigma regulatory factor
MLRIETLHEACAIRLKLEGKVIRGWITEARRAWMEASNGKELIVDLIDVTFVDDQGRKLLSEMHAAGACLVGCGPMIGELIEDIHREIPRPDRNRAREVLLLLLGL